MVIAQRCAAQLLSGPPARDPVDVAERLLAVQAQDPRGARLAIRARTAGLHARDVDRALGADRSLVITWLNRGTLHLVRATDYWWLHQLTTPPAIAGNARRLAQEGVPPDAAKRGVAAVERALARDGPLTRARLGEQISAAGVRTQGQALVHVLMLACLQGVAVRGPMIGRDQAYVLVRDWLPAPPAPVARDTALAMLARRYLAGHGPATDRDLAKWAGLPLRDARCGLAAIGTELDQHGDGLVSLSQQAPRGRPSGPAGSRGTPQRRPPGRAGSGPHAARLPPPRLLGAYEPVLLGWESRAPILDSNQGIVTVNGLFRPFALVRGRAVATWRMAAGEIAMSAFADISRADAAALDADAADVRRFLGAPRPAV